MDGNFLGDSYDLVKRFFAENLSSIAPIYADKRFIPDEIHEAYFQITRIPMFHESVEHPFAIILDPCTGIKLKCSSKASPTKAHVPLPYIREVFEKYRPDFLISFDQSFSRNGKKEPLMYEKINVLNSNGISAFYFSSHANFLFASESMNTIRLIWQRLLKLGVPNGRLVSKP